LLAQVEKLPPATDQPKVDSQRLRPHVFSLNALLQGIRTLLLLSLVLVVTDAAANLVQPLFVRSGIDTGVPTHNDKYILGMAALALLVVVFDWFIVQQQTIVSTRAGETLLYTVRMRSYAHLQRLGLDFYEKEMAGRIMTRMTTDVDALSTFLQTGLVSAVVSLATVAGIIVIMLFVNPLLALVAFSVLPFLIVATLVFRKYSAAAYSAAREQISIVNADLQENVSGLRVSQANTQESRTAAQFSEMSNKYRTLRLRSQTIISIFFPFISFLSDLSQAIVLGVGAYWVASSTIAPGVLIAFLLYLGQFFGPLQQLSQVFDGYQQAAVGLQRIGELLDTPTSVPQPDNPRSAPRLRGTVEFADVTFSYDDADSPAIDGMSFAVQPGETVALVGATGAGKSTVIKLLARFYDPTYGAVKADDIDLRELDLPSFHGRLGLVPQEAHLFTGTVAENIRYGNPDATDAQVHRAVEKVGALDFIAALSDGFHHEVGERGQGLSAGQRQLIALARAQLVDPDILLFDEATAALSPATEEAVLAAGAKLTEQRTTFVVAHRLATAARADRIFVLDHGKIIEEGNHATLLSQDGEYAKLWSLGQAHGTGTVFVE
jgi:ATP-binding cassette subfamily B protein